MLALCSEGANASYIIGDYDTMNQLIDEVLSMDISVKDKFKVYEVKILALQGVGKHHESISLEIIGYTRQTTTRFIHPKG